MRLVDADSWRMYFYECMDDPHMAAAKNALDAMPTIDAVPVVRCCDCKWYYTDACQIKMSNYGLKDDGYCDYGEWSDDD